MLLSHTLPTYFADLTVYLYKFVVPYNECGRDLIWGMGGGSLVWVVVVVGGSIVCPPPPHTSRLI